MRLRALIDSAQSYFNQVKVTDLNCVLNFDIPVGNVVRRVGGTSGKRILAILAIYSFTISSDVIPLFVVHLMYNFYVQPVCTSNRY